ncbi:unnamed protein product, partial [Mesorhabditis spiculigera]
MLLLASPVCVCERAMEVRLRAAAECLSEDLAPTLNQRTTYWKARTSELGGAERQADQESSNKGHNERGVDLCTPRNVFPSPFDRGVAGSKKQHTIVPAVE